MIWDSLVMSDLAHTAIARKIGTCPEVDSAGRNPGVDNCAGTLYFLVPRHVCESGLYENKVLYA